MTAAVLATAALAGLLLVAAYTRRIHRVGRNERAFTENTIDTQRATIRFLDRLCKTERLRAQSAEARAAQAEADADAARMLAAAHLCQVWRLERQVKAVTAENQRLAIGGIEAQLRELEAGR